MKASPFVAIRTALILLSFAAIGAACTAKKPAPPEPEIGKAFYLFAPAEVSEIAVTDQTPGRAPWIVRARKDAGSSALKPTWTITSAPGTLSDTVADGGFIVHLLDTFQTLWAIEKAPNAPLSKLGLDPAWRIIQWKTADGKTYELRTGDQIKAGGRAAQFSPETGAYLTEGAAMRMLDHLEDWQTLRKRTLADGVRDDIDIIEIKTPGSKTPIRANRHAEDWENDRKRPYADAFSKEFERFMHQRILRFLDSEADAAPARNGSSEAKVTQITLWNRQNNAQGITIFAQDGRVFAQNTARANAWFELYPEAAANLSAWIQAASTPVKSGIK